MMENLSQNISDVVGRQTLIGQSVVKQLIHRQKLYVGVFPKI